MATLLVFIGISLIFLVGQSSLWASASLIHIQHQPPYFSPQHLQLSLGTPLHWENQTGEPHSIVSDDCQSPVHCSFDSGLIGPRETFRLPHLKPGRYPYHCGIHPFMRGQLTIHPPQAHTSTI